MKRTIGIVGGGAAGMTAAILAARQGAGVTLLEGNDRLGRINITPPARNFWQGIWSSLTPMISLSFLRSWGFL